MPRGENMAFCGICGAEKADLNAQCNQCGVPPPEVGQYYQPMPYMPPPPRSPDEDVGKALGIVALIIVIVVIVTVVLAAVLYVMVIGFGTGGVVTNPVGTWSNMEAIDSTSARLTFGTFSDNVEPTDIQISVWEGSSGAGILIFSTPSEQTTELSWFDGPAGASAVYVDYNYAGNSINSGDHIILEGLEPNTTYRVDVYHYLSDSSITMTGIDSFTTDP